MKILERIYTEDIYGDGNRRPLTEFLILNNIDWIDITTGDERAGKTTLSYIKCRLANPNFGVDDYTLGLEEFLKRIDTCPQGSAVLCDEGGDAFISKLAMSRKSIKATQQLMKIGEKNLFICINISDLSLLERYIKNHRLKCLCRVRIKYKNGVLTRGIVEIYTRKQTRQIRKTVDGNMKYPKPAGVDVFSAIPEDDPLWIACKAKKDVYIKFKRKEKEVEDIIDEMCRKYGKESIISRTTISNEIVKKKQIKTRQARNIITSAINSGKIAVVNRGRLQFR
jgi:hypothetical protein